MNAQAGGVDALELSEDLRRRVLRRIVADDDLVVERRLLRERALDRLPDELLVIERDDANTNCGRRHWDHDPVTAARRKPQMKSMSASLTAVPVGRTSVRCTSSSVCGSEAGRDRYGSM